MTIEIKLRKGEPIDRAIRRLKKRLDREGVIRDVRAKRYFEKPSDKRRVAPQSRRFFPNASYAIRKDVSLCGGFPRKEDPKRISKLETLFMSQLQKRLSPNLRLEWKLLDQEKASALEFLSLCEKMIKVGEFLLAHDVARAGLKKFKKHKRLSQRAGHALSKAGSPMMATKILEELVAGGDRDVETHSLLASAYKDLWEYSSDQSSKKKYAELAIARYQEAYLTNSFDSLRLSQRQELETQYYPCINVAFMHFLSGDLEKGRENAEKARQICRKLKDQGTSDYWIRVTEAEALLLLGSIEEAASAYGDAVSSGNAEPSQIMSTCKQALQIAAVYEDETIFEEISFAFPKLGIVACSGHVIDSPGGARRFPPEAEPQVKRKIEEALNQWGQVVYSSAACGTDILFLETMAERGGETHVFLPFAKEEFIGDKRQESRWQLGGSV